MNLQELKQYLEKIWRYVRPLYSGEPVSAIRIYISILQVIILTEIIRGLITWIF